MSSTTHLEIPEAHLRSVSQFLGLRKILPPPSTNAAFSQARVEEKIKSHGFCSDISHFMRLILTRKKSSITRVLIFNGLARKQPQLSFGLRRISAASSQVSIERCCVESMSFCDMISEAQIEFCNTSRDIRSSPQMSFSISGTQLSSQNLTLTLQSSWAHSLRNSLEEI